MTWLNLCQFTPLICIIPDKPLHIRLAFKAFNTLSTILNTIINLFYTVMTLKTLLIAGLLTGSTLISACQDNNPQKPQSNIKQAHNIEAIVLLQNPPHVKTDYRYYDELIISKDLNLNYTRRNYRGAVLLQTHRRIKPEIFYQLSQILHQANFGQLPAAVRLQPDTDDKGSLRIKILTPLRSYDFESSETQILPEALIPLQAQLQALLPKEEEDGIEDAGEI